MTVTTTLIGDYYKDVERQEIISYQGAFMGFGGMIFISMAGYLADVSWRLPFAIYGFSILILVLAIKYLKEPIIKITDENQLLTNDQKINNTTIYTIYFSGFIGIVLFYILPLQIPFYVKSLGYKSSTLAGLAISALTTSQAISSFFYRQLKSKYTFTTIFSISFLMMAIGFFIISFSVSYWQVLLGLIISGIGTAWLMPNSNLWIMASTPENLRGKYIGRLTTFIFLGQFMSPIFVQPIQNIFGNSKTFLILSGLLIGLSFLYYVKNKNAIKQTN